MGEILIFGFLVIMLGTPVAHHILVKRAKDKYRDGIQTGLGAPEELMNILRRLQCSFIKEIYYDETGNVALKTKWGKHTLVLQNGIVSTSAEEFDTKYSNEKMIVERNALFEYILKELDHTAPIDAYKYYNTGKRLVQLHRWTPRVFWAGVIVFLVIFAGNLFGDKAVDGVKNAHPNAYPNITYGEAFDFFFNSGEWNSFDSESGQTVVEYTGKAGNTDKESVVVFQFVISDDYETFSPESVEIDGLEFNDWVASLCVMSIFENYDKGEKGNTSDALDEFWNDVNEAY